MSGCSDRSASEAEPFRMGWGANVPHATPSRVERRGRGWERDALDSMGSLFASNDVDAGETDSSSRLTWFRGDLHQIFGAVVGIELLRRGGGRGAWRKIPGGPGAWAHSAGQVTGQGEDLATFHVSWDNRIAAAQAFTVDRSPMRELTPDDVGLAVRTEFYNNALRVLGQ